LPRVVPVSVFACISVFDSKIRDEDTKDIGLMAYR